MNTEKAPSTIHIWLATDNNERTPGARTGRRFRDEHADVAALIKGGRVPCTI